MSSEAVQAMGPVSASRFAQVPPPPEVQAAAGKGTTIPAAKTETVVQPGGTAPHWGNRKLAFDYTHLGREGADYFAKQVVDALGEQVPEMRPLLIR